MEGKASLSSDNSVQSDDSQESVTAYPALKVKQEPAKSSDGPPVAQKGSAQLTKSASHVPKKSASEVPRDFQQRKSFNDASAASAAEKAAVPTGSVKDAVSKFGGITNWKAHKVRSLERQKTIEDELKKVEEEIPDVKKEAEAAEESKNQVLKELDNTKRLVEEFKLNLERAQKEEQQAKQDSELAKLRLEEVEKGIVSEGSVAAKKELEVAKARHLAAVSDLDSLKKELETVRKDYASLMDARHTAVMKAEEAVVASKAVEKTVENLTVELMSTKQFLESAHASHLEAEEQRSGAAKAQEQDVQDQEKELKQAEEDLEKLNQKVLSGKDVKSKLDTASAMLKDLKAEYAAYLESKQKAENGEIASGSLEGHDINTDDGLHAALASTTKSLDELTLYAGKELNEVNKLKAALASLQTNLETEKSEQETMRQREKTASETVASLEAELERTKKEISLIQVKGREEKEELVELPKKLQKADEEADQAKSLAKAALEELVKAKEEGNQSKARISTTESRLLAVKKEIEATRAAERLALKAIEALQRTQTHSDEDLPDAITLSLTEYYQINKQAHDAETRGNDQVTESLSLIEAAKESEATSLKKLEKLTTELAAMKAELEKAKQKGEKANEAKSSAEQQLRELKGEPEPQQKTEPTEGKKKKKRSILPKLFMFMGKKKSHSHSHSKGH
ncbi:protein WEAK CHLOROPLAST MOVEMENT UNDER BLUE LIGHT 1-like [Apium graveolens]|uniref:protein WEAK CHLOROPLAST MOVEMENT UNDER BLUE LIGHT 1-like n=1 Tax=Apium graveolens TaxID=4045 RepID=UPI003D7A98FB